MTHLLIFCHAKSSQIAFEADSFQLFLAMEKCSQFMEGEAFWWYTII